MSGAELALHPRPGSPVRLAGRSGWRQGRWILAAGLAAGLVIAAEADFSGERAAEAPWALRDPVFGPASFPAALAASDARIEDKQTLLRAFPEDWSRAEALVIAYQDRFRLTGRYEDLALAAEAMRRARALAAEPGGPVLSAAELALSTHRLAAAEGALGALRRWAVPPESAARAEARALAGDIAFYRGDIPGAMRAYADAAAIEPNGLALRMAIADKAQGRFDEAVAGLRAYLDGLKKPSPLTVATIGMQIGAVELQRGNTLEARRRFEEANRTFPGFWLIEAHLAQAEAVKGNPRRAIAQMRGVAERSESAEVMDALAMLLRTYGQPVESRSWAQRAGAIWARRIDLMPEAAYGHAVEHELVFGTPARALALARRNLTARPFGESRLLLASALLQNGRVAEALEELRIAEATGWRSAPLYALRAEALALDGRQSEAARARAAAEALNPRIFEPETALIWFSHG